MNYPLLNFTLLLLVSAFTQQVHFRVSGSSEAYVTLLYGDEFLLGVRVLGKSIRDTGSEKDMVVLVSDGVSDYAKKLLKADGWIVELISLLANPNQMHPKRFWGVYTKLKIFNMTKYEKVVYLDADTVVVKNIEDVFKCSKFCANLKHSERLNSGVLVVEPSEVVFRDMMSKISTLPSYTGGDQGFLNSYFVGFASARVFDPNLSLDNTSSLTVPQMERLSTLYNADVGLYMLANKWMVDENEIRIIHYTLGPLKPWDWWTAWLVKPVEIWQNFRVQLEESLPRTGQGKNPGDSLMIKFLSLFPFCVFLCYYYSCQHRRWNSANCHRSVCNNVRHLFYRLGGMGPSNYSGVGSLSLDPDWQLANGAIPFYLGAASIFVCFASVAVSILMSLMLVPRQATPWTGLLLMYEWTFMSSFVLFGSYLRFVAAWGRRSAIRLGSCEAEGSTYSSVKGNFYRGTNWEATTYLYAMGMLIFSIAVPAFPCLFGITALFARLSLMVVGLILLATFMTYASEHLAIGAFRRGWEDQDHSRGGNNCVLC